MRRFSLFLFVVLFAGSAVVFGARDIRKRLAPPSDAEKAKVESMLRDFKGEAVIPAQKAAISREHVPHRSYGSYLPSKDIERIKKFLFKVIKSDESEDKK